MTYSPFDDPDSTEEERDAYRAWMQCTECRVTRGLPHLDGCSGQFREDVFGGGEARKVPCCGQGCNTCL